MSLQVLNGYDSAYPFLGIPQIYKKILGRTLTIARSSEKLKCPSTEACLKYGTLYTYSIHTDRHKTLQPLKRMRNQYGMLRYIVKISKSVLYKIELTSCIK